MLHETSRSTRKRLAAARTTSRILHGFLGLSAALARGVPHGVWPLVGSSRQRGGIWGADPQSDAPRLPLAKGWKPATGLCTMESMALASAPWKAQDVCTPGSNVRSWSSRPAGVQDCACRMPDVKDELEVACPEPAAVDASERPPESSPRNRGPRLEFGCKKR